jgi:hypothetical protein
MDETVPAGPRPGYWTKGQWSEKITPMPDAPDAVCDLCGKSVLPAPEVEVREGEKRYHLECYVRDKRRAGRERPASD